VIVVAGNLRSADPAAVTVERLAERVAALGSRVEAVGILDPDGAGDQVLLRLRAAGVGHAAVLRSSAPALEPADLDLALRYLPDIKAIVLLEPAADVQAIAAASAAWSAAGLIVVRGPGEPSGGADTGPADRTMVLAAPGRDPDGAFAGVVAALATRLEAGATPADAWAATVAALGVEPVQDDPVEEEPVGAEPVNPPASA